MILYGHKELETLMKIPENNKCFDCFKKQTSWVSINNGVFLCTTCAGEHRSYGVNISFIRSLTLDLWKDSQAEMLKNAGNKRLLSLLEIYNIDIIKINKKTFYFSSLAEFYRKLLRSEYEGINVNLTMPTKEVALKSYSLNTDSNYEYKINPFYKKVLKEKEKEKDDFKTVSSSEDSKKTQSDKEGGFISNIDSWIGGTYILKTITMVPEVMITQTNNITSTLINKSVDCIVRLII